MDIKALLSLARHGCYEKMVEVSSSKLAVDLATSQQTASRRIKALEEEGYVVREILPKGQKIKITAKGFETLRQIYHDLENVFKTEEGQHAYSVHGVLTSGMGEGRYYMEREGYRKQFKEKLGFDPYPGTLNFKLKTEEDIKTRRILQNLEGIEIKGFTQNNRTFGPVKCFRAEVEGIEGAVVIPERTHHGFNTLEVIAPVKIRDLVALKDGDAVHVKIWIGEKSE
jgi:riboflavin kinase